MRMTQWLEKTVRDYPEQWNWMNIRWQEDQDKAALVKEQRVQNRYFLVKKGDKKWQVTKESLRNSKRKWRWAIASCFIRAWRTTMGM